MVARKLLLPFPSSYLAECGFSAVNDLLLKKRNRLDIIKRGDLRLKLTKLEPDIRSLCSDPPTGRTPQFEKYCLEDSLIQLLPQYKNETQSELFLFHQAVRRFQFLTATAASDVVQSGRPIFDDFFQHLWPYIGNNTANVVFQRVKRLWLIRIDQ
ncbi:uncharacterized protein TNCV_3633921 [Trichonephila clavipes]|nr:uncharacterized protein TNCV_3633921 [Trichonephila clavipes]